MIGLITAKSVKQSYYKPKGRRPRVGDMIVSHDLAVVKNYSARIHFSVIRPRYHLYRSHGTHPTDPVL